jgi:hypothetical protein
MDNIMKSEIFFVVTTVAVVVVTVGASIALFYIIKLLRTVDEVSEDIKGNVAAFGSWLRGNALMKRFFTPARKGRKSKRVSVLDEE